ncbi:hypothetical protein GPY61_02095 [Massilia sp. NEAU-DD11]|uniref:ABC transporter substrate-binding protein n=1 Tax=Massilia cellulosiltytica TaxID=2683234 RepID=A0A7X3FVI2_9BURK|nr:MULTISPECIES: hypothetical protein [Telluria group]MVW58717.1 hypothetical protein [Telluria cellulosilytica]
MGSRLRGNDGACVGTSSPRRQGPNVALAALMLTTSAHAFSTRDIKPEPVQGYRFQVVTTDDSAITRRIVDDITRRLVPVFAVFRTELAQHRRMLYVTVGPAALREVAQRRCDCVVVSTFTSSQVVRSILGTLPPARAATFTAVYAEPAPVDQLRLVALLYRRPVRVAAILGPDTAFLKPLLEGEHVNVLEGDSDEGINRLLGQIAQTDVLLALPDSAVYNTENFRNILLSAYRKKQGVIGFSADMVKAGALATTYSEVEDINSQVAEIVASYVAGGELPPPQFPRYFHTIVNEGVARSLDVEVPDNVRNFARPAPARQP